MTLPGRRMCDESPRITVDLLKLIVSCKLTVSCHIRRLDLLKDCVMHLFESWCHYDWDYKVLWFDGDG